MKRFYILFVILLSTVNLYGQTTESGEKPVFNEGLARKLGADEYGMKKYVMAFLKSGKTKVSKEEGEKLQNAHLKNIIRLSNEGKLVVAGPFLDNGEVRGIYIFNVESIEEAKKLTETDPAITRGTLEFELRPWYGSAALMEIVKIHKTLEKKSVAN
jgi:uncharacterized protein